MDNQAKFTHGGNIHQLLRQTGDMEAPLLDFSANINPLGLSVRIEEAIRTAIPSLIHYPDPDGQELKQEIASFYGVDTGQITLGNGAVELLYILCHTLRVKHALIPAPSFSEYERAARAVHADIRYHFLSRDTQFCLFPDEFLPAIGGADLICIGNPNNPTGRLTRRRDLERCIVAAAEKNCFVVIDESFLDFLPDAEEYTCRHLVSKYKNLLVLHSLTKFYAIPGLRLGFAVTHPELTNELHKGKDPWNVNALAQRAGVTALRDARYQVDTRAFLAREKADFYRCLTEIPDLAAIAPSVNFLLIDLTGTRWTGVGLKEAMLAYNILIRDCGNYPGLGASYIRLAVKSHQENQRCFTRLKEIITKGEPR